MKPHATSPPNRPELKSSVATLEPRFKVFTRGSVVATLGVMKRRKPVSQRKEQLVRVRVTEEQKGLLMQAAEQTGLDVSSWIRALALQAAKRTTSLALDIDKNHAHTR